MAKAPVIEETEDGGMAIELTPRETRKFKGSDADPVDAATGESVFDDLSPRFNKKLDEAAAKARVSTSDDEETGDEELPQDEVDEELPVEDEDEVQADEETDDTDEVDDVDEVEERQAGKKNKFEKRLDRANRLVDETRAESAALRARLDQQEANNRAQADEAKYSNEKTKLEADLTTARAEYRKAIEDGNTDAQVDANDKVADIKGDLKVLDIRHNEAKIAVEAAKKQTGAGPIVKLKSDQWIRKHARFNTDKEFAATARAVDQQVLAAGHNPETDAYYKEIDKRMAKFYPKEFKVQGKSAETVPVRRKHPASGMRREEGGGQAPKVGKTGPFKMKGNRVMLSAQNIKTMRDFNMDPTNPNDVRDFVEQNR